MNRPVTLQETVTASVDAETLAIVDQLARERGITVAEYAAEAVCRVAESEADFRAISQVGIDAVDRGDVIPHEAVMAELDAMIEKHRARCSK